MSQAAPAGDDRFARDVLRLLLTFLAVSLIDLTAVSLLTGRLRFWFPVWLDPAWETRPGAWVIYSQSYLAGIACIPLLARAIERELLTGRTAGFRAAYWTGVLALLGFIGWWKGGLMVAHGKEREALGWLALTGLVWGLLRLAEWLPGALRGLSRVELLRRLLLGVAAFFLVMSLLDPLLQVAVQGLPWSSGLIVEVGFFVPAGLALLALTRHLGRREARRSA